MSQTEVTFPICIFLLSGKRKSGKDFFTDLLSNRFGTKASVIRLSAPIKEHWAESHGLDLTQLLDSTSYKETHRQDMIKWGESMRESDHGFFCRIAIKMSKATEKPIWIVSDARRKTDIAWFYKNYNEVKTVRICADVEVRKSRGWIFTNGVDDAPSECDLDDYHPWDYKIINNGGSDLLMKEVELIVNSVKELGINC